MATKASYYTKCAMKIMAFMLPMAWVRRQQQYRAFVIEENTSCSFA